MEPAPTAPLLANRSFVSLRSLDLDVLRGDIKSENSNLTTCLSLPYGLSTMLKVSRRNREKELLTEMAQIVRLLPYDWAGGRLTKSLNCELPTILRFHSGITRDIWGRGEILGRSA